MKLCYALFICLLPVFALAQEQSPQTVTVTGTASMRPGIFEVPPNGLTLLQVLAMSGGVLQGASPFIEIVRFKPQTNTTEAEKQSILVTLDDLRNGRIKDVSLHAGDVIFIPLQKPYLLRPPEIPPEWLKPSKIDPRVGESSAAMVRLLVARTTELATSE